MAVKEAFLCLINGYIFTGQNIIIYGTHKVCRIVEMLSLSTDFPNPFIKGGQIRIQMEYLQWKYIFIYDQSMVDFKFCAKSISMLLWRIDFVISSLLM